MTPIQPGAEATEYVRKHTNGGCPVEKTYELEE